VNDGHCEYCFEKRRNCVCVWTKCADCGKRIPESLASEYRGRVWCEEAHDFDEQVAKRDHERAEAMQEVEASINSQRKGEFINNRGKYHSGNVASDGLPVIKVKEPLRLQEYEGRILP
jgi:hypothetical protein